MMITVLTPTFNRGGGIAKPMGFAEKANCKKSLSGL